MTAATESEIIQSNILSDFYITVIIPLFVKKCHPKAWKQKRRMVGFQPCASGLPPFYLSPEPESTCKHDTLANRPPKVCNHCRNENELHMLAALRLVEASSMYIGHRNEWVPIQREENEYQNLASLVCPEKQSLEYSFLLFYL